MQTETHLPLRLGDHLEWVRDEAKVDSAATLGIKPLAYRNADGQWQFRVKAPTRTVAEIASKAQLIASKVRATSIKLELNTIRSILWVRPDAIGDAVIAGELLEQIKSRFPSASIVVVCQDRVSPFYQNCPAVSSIISFNRNSFSSDSRYAESVVTKLVSARADLALCSVFSRDAICDILMARSGAPIRVGMMGDCSNQSEAQKDVGNKAFTHLIKSVGFSRPEAERHSDFLYALCGARLRLSPRVWLSAEDESSATRFFAETNINPRKTIALFSGAQNAIRKYDKFTESLSDFCQLSGFSVITLGGPQDQVAHTEVCTALSVAGVRCYDLSGKLTLGESAAILKAVALGVGSETGLAHIASAVGTPHVVLLGGGHAGRFMPHSVLTSAVCLPLACFGCNWKCGYSRPHCIRDVHPAVLRRAIEDALHSVSEKPRLYLQGNIFYDQTNGMPDFQFKQGAFNCDLLNIIHVSMVDGTECQRHPELQPDSKTVDRTHGKNLEVPLPLSRKEKLLTFLV
jgi:ADP-heptose:LPS heptosyltransferase